VSHHNAIGLRRITLDFDRDHKLGFWFGQRFGHGRHSTSVCREHDIVLLQRDNIWLRAANDLFGHRDHPLR